MLYYSYWKASSFKQCDWVLTWRRRSEVCQQCIWAWSECWLQAKLLWTYCQHQYRKAHARANLILRCFISGHRLSTINVFKVYVRPLLEYNSSVWSPSLKCVIELLENVQRRLSKRTFGLYSLTYHQRLICSGLESLELRRLRLDLLLVYKIVFGLTGFRSEEFSYQRQ